MLRRAPALLLLVLCAGCARDTEAEWDQESAALVPIRGERVTLLVTPGEQGRPELARLAAELDRAAAEMAPRIPSSTGPPVTVVVEPDHVAQGRHTGEIGEAVPGRQTDLHLVWDARDLSAYRFALAQTLLARAGLAGKAPLWIERGAALWLSQDWYGRPYADWLPLLSKAGALPSVEDLLAERQTRDASAPLWTPVAAAVVERLPGTTLAEKLGRAVGRAEVERVLASLRAPVKMTPSQALITPALFSRPPPDTPPQEKREKDSPCQSVLVRVRPCSPLPVRGVGRRSGEGPGVRVRVGEVRFLKGISLAMLNSLEGGYHAPALALQLDRLKALGANSVSLMPFAFQREPDRPELGFVHGSPRGETDVGMIHATRVARARGFHVLYKPHLWISRGSWAGDVAMKSEEDWALWWRSYRRYVLHHAFLARWSGANLFSVGVELSKTVGREREWRDLIAAVRVLYPGLVTYSGNWYGDLEAVRFWDQLDFIGIDAYYPLSTSPAATRKDLDRGAREIASRLAAASKRLKRPILLTEVGFAAHRSAWVAPHTEGGDYSEDDQALAYEALFKALGRPPWLAGTFVWKAFSAPGSDGGGRADFRFLGRKAEGVVRGYYQEPSSPRPSSPTALPSRREKEGDRQTLSATFPSPGWGEGDGRGVGVRVRAGALGV